MILNLKRENLSERQLELRMAERFLRQPSRCKHCEHLHLDNSVYSHLYASKIFGRKENLTMDKLIAKCAKSTKSEAERKMIGLDNEKEFW